MHERKPAAAGPLVFLGAVLEIVGTVLLGMIVAALLILAYPFLILIHEAFDEADQNTRPLVTVALLGLVALIAASEMLRNGLPMLLVAKGFVGAQIVICCLWLLTKKD